MHACMHAYPPGNTIFPWTILVRCALDYIHVLIHPSIIVWILRTSGIALYDWVVFSYSRLIGHVLRGHDTLMKRCVCRERWASASAHCYWMPLPGGPKSMIWGQIRDTQSFESQLIPDQYWSDFLFQPGVSGHMNAHCISETATHNQNYNLCCPLTAIVNCVSIIIIIL